MVKITIHFDDEIVYFLIFCLGFFSVCPYIVITSGFAKISPKWTAVL
jgi:hypothetical protein